MPRESKQLTSSRQRIKLHVLGAAGDVTGSLNLFEYFEDGRTVRFILDIGLHQGDEGINRQNRLPKGITPSNIDFVIISHAHIDHSGWLPAFIKAGFKGPVYTHPATRDLMEFLLPDSGYLQEAEADRANRRAKRLRGGRNVASPAKFLPLYTEEDAEASLKRVRQINYDQTYQLTEGIKVKFTNACHIIGAAVVSLTVGKSDPKKICFTGNIGRANTPLLRDLAPVLEADYLLTESTYGNKLHEKRDRLTVLADIVNRAIARAKRNGKNGCGVILIPAFAVGRVQAVVYDLRQLIAEGRIPNLPVFLDSPMAIAATKVHRKHADLYNEEARKLLASGIDPISTPRFVECDKRMAAMLDGKMDEPTIIIGSSGMAAGGRILQRIKTRLPGAQNTVLFVGYQGTGVLGHKLTSSKPRSVRIHGDVVRCNATIEYMSDYSGHADYEEMIAWMEHFQRAPRQTFLVHGEPESLSGFKKHIEERLGWSVIIPQRRQCFDL